VSARIRKMAALTSPVTLSFVSGLVEVAKARSFREVQITRDKYGNFVTVDQLGREVLLVVPARQPPAETDNAKRFCEALYGEGNVTVQKVK
jgi:hypothetical protein